MAKIVDFSQRIETPDGMSEELGKILYAAINATDPRGLTLSQSWELGAFANAVFRGGEQEVISKRLIVRALTSLRSSVLVPVLEVLDIDPSELSEAS